MRQQRDGRLKLPADPSGRVARLNDQLKSAARGDEHVLMLHTHPGIGLLTSLALIRILDPVSRFTSRGGLSPVLPA